jgi:hypothetical protein
VAEALSTRPAKGVTFAGLDRASPLASGTEHVMTTHPLRRFTVLVLRIFSCAALASASVAYAQLFPRLDPTVEIDGCGFPCHTQASALDGNTAVVVNSINHAVEIHTRGADNSWSLTAVLFDPDIPPPPPPVPPEESPPPDNPYENSNFGSAVALSGGVLLVASSTVDGGNALAVHKVFVFRRVAQQWLLRQTINMPPPPNVDAFFITSLALDDSTALVGTVSWARVGEENNERGTVHVFRKAASGAFQLATKVSPRDAVNSNFGVSLDIQGNIFVVGANLRDESRGAAYVYQRGHHGWALRQLLPGPGRIPSAEFGSVVAISGRTLAIGAPASGVPRSTLEGKVFVFNMEAQRWRLRQTLLNPLGDAVPDFTVPISTFGAALDIDGKRLIVASDFPFNESGTPFATAFLFERRGGRWTAAAEFGRDPPGEVSISGSTALLLDKTRFGAVPTIYQLPALSHRDDAFAEGDDTDAEGADLLTE